MMWTEAEAARARDQAIQRQMRALGTAHGAETSVGSVITDEGVRKSIRLKNVPRLAVSCLWFEKYSS